jgi:hypothetical protein
MKPMKSIVINQNKQSLGYSTNRKVYNTNGKLYNTNGKLYNTNRKYRIQMENIEYKWKIIQL